VEIAIGRERSLDRALGVCGSRDVGCDELSLQAFRRRRASFDFGIADDHPGAFFMEALGDPGANAARSANDQRDLARETSTRAIRQNASLLEEGSSY